MTINQIMSRPVEPIDPTTTIAAAAGKMRDEGVGCLLVVKDDQLFGIVTDRDIAVRALADGRKRHPRAGLYRDVKPGSVLLRRSAR